MVEAAIVLPVLGVLLLALPVLAARYAARQAALLEARGCAWALAMSGCVEVPSDCDASRAYPEPSETPADALERTDVVTSTRAQVGSGGGDVFDEVPVIGEALSAILGDTARASARVERRVRTDLFEVAEHDLAIACNERPRNVLDMAIAVFCEHLPFDACGGSDGS